MDGQNRILEQLSPSFAKQDIVDFCHIPDSICVAFLELRVNLRGFELPTLALGHLDLFFQLVGWGNVLLQDLKVWLHT